MEQTRVYLGLDADGVRFDGKNQCQTATIAIRLSEPFKIQGILRVRVWRVTRRGAEGAWPPDGYCAVEDAAGWQIPPFRTVVQVSRGGVSEKHHKGHVETAAGIQPHDQCHPQQRWSGLQRLASGDRWICRVCAGAGRGQRANRHRLASSLCRARCLRNWVCGVRTVLHSAQTRRSQKTLFNTYWAHGCLVAYSTGVDVWIQVAWGHRHVTWYRCRLNESWTACRWNRVRLVCRALSHAEWMSHGAHVNATRWLDTQSFFRSLG